MKTFSFKIILFLTITFIAHAKIKHIRVIWHEDPAHESLIAWSNRAPGAHLVYFDTTPNFGKLSEYQYKMPSSYNERYKNSTNILRGLKLKNLKPDTLYYFVIKSSRSQSPEYHFRTAPLSKEKPYTLIFGGDSRTSRKNRKRINRYISQFIEKNPQTYALIHGGDYITFGSSWPLWHFWLKDHQLTFTREGRILPIIPTRGNHETNKKLYNQIFLYPGGEKKDYMNTRIGDLSIITLDTNISMAGNQHLWLKSSLKKASEESKWIFTNYHAPAYPGIKGPSGAKKHFVPLFEKYQVDLVFESDGHTLKKTLPIYQDQYDDKKGIIYIGEGGLGVKMRKPKKELWYLQPPGYSSNKYHMITTDIYPDSVRVNIQLFDGNLFDQFTLYPRDRSN